MHDSRDIAVVDNFHLQNPITILHRAADKVGIIIGRYVNNYVNLIEFYLLFCLYNLFSQTVL